MNEMVAIDTNWTLQDCEQVRDEAEAVYDLLGHISGLLSRVIDDVDSPEIAEDCSDWLDRIDALLRRIDGGEGGVA